MESIATVNRQFGTAILMIEQNVKYSLPLAHRVTVLKTVRYSYDAAPAPLQDRDPLMNLFLLIGSCGIPGPHHTLSFTPYSPFSICRVTVPSQRTTSRGALYRP